MDIETYRRKRQAAQLSGPTYRELCVTCRQPSFSCFCRLLCPIDCKMDFVILIHPIEVRRRIATGRMSHLSLKNSRLIAGMNFPHHSEVNSLIGDSRRECVLLYPGRQSKNLTLIPRELRKQEFSAEKKLTIFVVDGTWATARKMVNQSPNLASLPRIGFTPPTPSAFRVRKQPRAECYSTIEAIHHPIELLNDGTNRDHDYLLKLFNQIIERELHFAQAGDSGRKYRLQCTGS